MEISLSKCALYVPFTTSVTEIISLAEFSIFYRSSVSDNFSRACKRLSYFLALRFKLSSS